MIPTERAETFTKILDSVGDAFLVRGEGKITTSEISGKGKNPRDVINEERIPGLKALIEQYKNTPVATTENTMTANDSMADNIATEREEGNQGTVQQTKSQPESQSEEVYEPPTIYTPRQIARHKLGFTKSEYDAFVLYDANNDGDAKIRCIIIELSKLDVSISMPALCCICICWKRSQEKYLMLTELRLAVW